MVKFRAKILNNKNTNQKSVSIPSYIIKYGHLEYIPGKLYHIEITKDLPLNPQYEIMDEMKEGHFSEDGNIKNLKQIESPGSKNLVVNFQKERDYFSKKLKGEINAESKNAKFENYHGDPIVKEDYDVLIGFEQKLGAIPKIIPKLSDFRYYKYGYITEENRVVELYLYNKELTDIPESIGQLKYIQTLDLRRNKFKVVPDSIGKLKNLIRLLLDENQIESLPKSIGNLTNLAGLFLYKNKLITLPETIGNLKNLIKLDLSYNKIAKLPETFKDLPIIHEFNFINNKLSTESDYIKNLQRKWLSEFYKSYFEKNRKKFREMKKKKLNEKIEKNLLKVSEKMI